MTVQTSPQPHAPVPAPVPTPAAAPVVAPLLDRSRWAPRMASSRAIGALFLAGFLSYGIGFSLVSSVVSGSAFAASIPAHRTTLVVGVLLMLLNSAVDVGKGVLFFPILARHSRRGALAYLATMVVEVVLLSVGALSLLILVPLAQNASALRGNAQPLALLAVAANDNAYQVAEMALGVGCILLCTVLLRSRLVPRFVAFWGVAGYAVLAAGTVAELLGAKVGVLASIPGGLFELTFGIWLIVKGFRPEGYGRA